MGATQIGCTDHNPQPSGCRMNASIGASAPVVNPRAQLAVTQFEVETALKWTKDDLRGKMVSPQKHPNPPEVVYGSVLDDCGLLQ
jgi:hypothetical protein